MKKKEKEMRARQGCEMQYEEKIQLLREIVTIVPVM
jgi:hypothetical protein